MKTSRRRARLAVGVVALGLGGCREAPVEPAPPAVNTAPPPAPVTPDRLPPGELLEGTIQVFHFPLPKAMRLDASFGDSAFAIGEVELQALTEYVKDRVITRHVEIIDGRTVFPSVNIRGGDDRRFRVEIVMQGTVAHLTLRDITPAPFVPGLTESQRWEKAGLTPNGELIDRNNLE